MRTNNNIRESLTAHQFEEALRMHLDLNIEITNVYSPFGAVAVRVTTDEVFELSDHPMVDYIDFPMRYELMSSPVNYASLLSSSVVSQTTPWGISIVNAPQVWPITTGTGAKVVVIDTGVENHVDLAGRSTCRCGGVVGGCADGAV